MYPKSKQRRPTPRNCKHCKRRFEATGSTLYCGPICKANAARKRKEQKQ